MRNEKELLELCIEYHKHFTIDCKNKTWNLFKTMDYLVFEEVITYEEFVKFHNLMIFNIKANNFLNRLIYDKRRIVDKGFKIKSRSYYYWFDKQEKYIDFLYYLLSKC